MEPGDIITLIHDSGLKKAASFNGIVGKYGFVSMSLCGDYKVNLVTGRLTAKRVRMWRVQEADLEKMRSRSKQDAERRKNLFKFNK